MITQKNQVMTDKTPSNSKKSRGKKAGPRSVADIIGGVMEPVLARRTGMTLDLIKAWPTLVSEEFAKTTRPEKIDWPRRAHEDDPFEPATLVVACESASALFFQHEQAPILERVNMFFGFQAIKRIRILQKPVLPETPAKKKQTKALSEEEKVRLQTLVENIDDPELKQILENLGAGIISKQ